MNYKKLSYLLLFIAINNSYSLNLEIPMPDFGIPIPTPSIEIPIELPKFRKKIKVNFDSVAGANEAKEELQEIVEFLKNSSKFKKIGAKIPKGVLLSGEPGNGKTLLAKALAGEAKCAFFSASGSEFAEVYVGKGAARVRDLFKSAKKSAPSIIFIDEIDAIAKKRGEIDNSELDRTLNQLLAEMDGFNSKDSVIVIGATNRIDILDPAILRPGRFDRKVYVPYPNISAREAILKIHSKKVPLDPDVDLSEIAKQTVNFSGAELASVINEAAISTVKKNMPYVTSEELEEAKEKVKFGKQRSDIIQSPEELHVIAVHESGHALIRILLGNTVDPIYKITILPRGHTLSKTYSMPKKDKYYLTKNEIESEILIALGGRAAEEVLFKQISTNSADDLEEVTGQVFKLVTAYGMAPNLGLLIYNSNYKYSQETANLIDKEMRYLTDKYYKRAFDMLNNNKKKLEILSKALLENRNLYVKDFQELLL